MDIPLVGFAPVGAWDDPRYDYIPLEQRPASLFSGGRTVIVIGMPVHLPVLDGAPSIWYNELYKTVNSILDQSSYRLATYLNEMGVPSVYVPRDGYPSLEYLRQGNPVMFSHRHAAVMAGLGSFGVNNTVLTPEYGPRVRFGVVITRAELTEKREELGGLCTRCGLCVKSCPVKAIDGKDYPDGIIFKEACASQNQELKEKGTMPCGICIAVCPVGRDREHFRHRNVP